MPNHMRSYEHTDVFENLRMRCNVVLKAAHGQILTAASDIDHILIHLVKTVERMSFVYMQYWSKVTLYITVSIRFITIRHITIFNVFKRRLLCSSRLHFI